MKRMKKILASLMVVVMLLSFAPLADLVGLDFGLKAEATSYKTGDIITFGMYPQNYVEDSYLRARLAEQEYDSKGVLEFEGKYYIRKIKYYSGYPSIQYYTMEPIDWRVLSVDSDGIYIVSKKALLFSTYNGNWEDSSLRNQLNGAFYNLAFSDAEKNKIAKTQLVNGDNPIRGNDGGADTEDYIFIPSLSDVIDESKGFSKSFDSDPSRMNEYTDYAMKYTFPGGLYSSGWLVRTPNVVIAGTGSITTDYDYYSSYISVRPALKLKLDSAVNKIKDYSNYNIRITDDTTGKPVEGADIMFNGSCYPTSKEGIATFSTTSSTADTDYIEIIKDGYEDLKVHLYELDPYSTNMLSISNKNNPISKVLADLYLDADTIKGPTVSILGQSFSFFTLEADLKIPLSKLSKLNVSTKNDTENKTVKYIVGVKPGYELDSDVERKDDYKKFKDFYQLATGKAPQQTKKAYDKIRRALKTEQGSLGFDCGINFAGFLEFSYASGEMKLVQGGIVVTAEASVSTDVPFGTICYATFKIGGEIEGEFTVSNSPGEVSDVAAKITVSVQPSFAAGFKIIMKELASVEFNIDGEISGSILLPATSLKNALTLNASLKCYMTVRKLFLFEEKWPTGPDCGMDIELYPNLNGFTTQSVNGEILFDENGNLLVVEEDDLELIDRSYLENINFGTSSFTPGDLNDTSVFPYGCPQLVELDDGRAVALFIYDDGTKSDINRTTLYYSVYSDGSWSKALPVYNSGLADFPVEVCTDGGKVYAVWLRASEIYDDNYSSDKIVDKTELVYAEFDGSVWSTPITVDTAEKYQTMYSIAEDNDNISVLWSEQALDADTSTVLLKTLSNGEWSDEEVVCSEQCVTDLAVGYNGGELMAVYSIDADKDPLTTEDSELYINGSQLTYNETDETQLSYQNGAFYWTQNGELYTYNTLGDICTSTGLWVEKDYRILKNNTTTAVTYIETDGFTNELMVSYLVDGNYTVPVKLTDYGKHIGYYDAVLNADGTIAVLADVDNLSDDEDAYPYTTTDMVCDVISGVTDLEITDVTYDGPVSRNGEVDFLGKVKNNGTTKIDKYTLKFKNSDGRVIRSEDILTSILPGEISEFSVSYLLPSDFVKQDITVEVVADNDNVTENNTTKITIGYADIEFIDASINEDGLLTAKVINNGYETAQNVNVGITLLADEDTLLTMLNVGSVRIGETEDITYQIPDEYLEFASAYVVNKFKLEATTDTEEESIGNNDIDAIYAPIAVESISINTSTLSLEYGQTSQLVATVYPSDAFNKKVHWISDSIDVATVDENGNITTVGTGTAIITAITDDGGLVAQCEVKVNVAVSSVDISQKTAEMISGQTLTLTADITPTGATNQNVTWTSSNISVATVSSIGVVSALKSGKTTITVKTEDGGYEASCLITVTTPVTGITISETSAKMYLGGVKQLTAAVTPSTADNQSIIWSSSDDYVVSVDSNGLLTAVGVGTATITATSVDGGYKKSCTVTVGKHVSNVLLSDSSLIVNVGASKQLTATVLPLNATDKSVEWISTNSSIASVDENGVITANAPGNATIIVSTNDGGFYATCDIFVCSSVTGFTLANNTENIKPNATVQMQPIFEPVDAENQNIIWTTSNNSIATVDENGLVTGKSIGTAVIVATTEDGGYRDYCLIRVLGLLPNDNTNTVVADGYVYGIDSGVDSLESFVTMSDSVCEIEYVNNESGFGTGTLANLVADGKVIDSYTIVIFGDVNGDSWYDGQDAIIVDCLANGMLTKDDVSEAVYMAADCNHDGVIDGLDVALLNQAGTLLANVDQSKPAEVLLETSSEYVEYISLIDQSPEIDIEDETDAPEVDVETEDTTPEQDVKIDIFEMIMNFIKSIFEMLLSYIPMPLK